MKKIIKGTLVALFAMNISCNYINSDKNKSVLEIEEIAKSKVLEWNEAHVAKDIEIFSKIYSDKVLFYGIQSDKNRCIESKLTFFRLNQDFYQQIYGDIRTVSIDSNEFKCTFVKRITLNQKTNDYTSYLVFKKINEKWLVVVEGDLVTDKNLKAQKEKIIIPKDAVSGDFNGDSEKDYMWLEIPRLKEGQMDCIGECKTYIRFSNPSIPSIKIENCIGGELKNLGDLNDNSTDEIGLLPSWFTSCWHAYHVWTFKSNKMIYAVEPFSTHCDQWSENIVPIEKDIDIKGNVIIRYSDIDGVKSKSIPINK